MTPAADHWNRLSARERGLAAATGLLVFLAACTFVGTRAKTRLDDLDHTAARLEQDLTNFAEQNARAESVDKAFAEVAAEHSSAWTEAEIHNRLRQEIYRLALEDPGAPVGRTRNLVEIPTLRQGSLRESGTGYREYMLSIRIPGTDVYSLILFLIRLQSSAQTLRIDGLDLARSPESQYVTATINVTRTVVEGTPGGETPTAQTPEKEPRHDSLAWDGDPLEAWHGVNCDLSLIAKPDQFHTGANKCLKAVAAAADAYAFMVRDLEPGAEYEINVDALAAGAAILQAVNDEDGQPYEGAQALVADGKPYLYRARFVAGGGSEIAAKVRVPVLVLKAPGTEIDVGSVTLRKVSK